MIYDIIIIGSGPAGLTAAIYGKRAGLTTLLLESRGMSGGQILNTYEVDNYPGLSGISGFELGQKFYTHAKELGVELRTGTVDSVEPGTDTHKVHTPDGVIEGRTVIVATGAGHRELMVPGEKELCGMGVSYCATCDGAFFKNRITAVVGGGDVALEDALFLARGCQKVYLIHRRDAFRGAGILQQRVKETENIEILYDTVVERINGEDMVTGISVYHKKEDARRDIDLSGVFIAVGILPETGFVRDTLQLDEAGYIVAGEDCETSVPGIFAAGDVRTKKLRQVITAAADGANAVRSAEEYLNRQKQTGSDKM